MENHSPADLRRARNLRREMSLPEVLLWKHLRRQPMGVRFRKQHPIDEFVVDFYCAAKRVAVEIDGIAHDMGKRPARDNHRDARLGALAVEVVHIPAAEVLRNVEAAADSIVRLCADRPPPAALRATTSPGGGGFSGDFR